MSEKLGIRVDRVILERCITLSLQRDVQNALGKALALLSSHLSETSSVSSLLAQVWLPDREDDTGRFVLLTRNLPFSVLGSGDQLALYRCYSCKYKFETDAGAKTEQLGAPGRVFLTGEPEMTHNVQMYSADTYKRVDDARKCKIFSTIVMPIYSASVPDHPFGVLEACSMNKDIPFEPVLTAVKMALEQHGLHTADFHTMPMHTTLRMLPPVEISLSGEESSHSQSSDHHQQHSSGQSVRPPITEATKTGAPEPMAYEDRRRSEAAECRESGEFTATKPLGHGAAPAVAPLMPAPSFVTGPPTFSIAATAGDASGLQFAQQAAVQQQHAQMQTLLVQAANFSHAMQANGGAMNGLGAAPPLPSGPQQQQALLALLQAQQLQQLQALQHHQQAAAQVVAARAAAPLIPSSNPLPIGPGPPARASAAAPIPPKLHPSTGGGLRVGSGKQGSPLGTSLDDAPEDLVYPKKAQAQGRKLTMEDLQQHFNVGLKEAASRLGICPTTLKRACRRFGIQRWPRRAIAKMQRQMSNANLRSEPGGSANSGGALAASLGNGLAGGGGGGAERRGARGAGLNGFGEDDRRASGEMAAPVGQGVMAHGFEVGDGFHGFMDIDEEALEGRKSAPPLDVLSVPGLHGAGELLSLFVGGDDFEDLDDGLDWKNLHP